MGLIPNLLQYRGLVGVLNNRNFCVQFKISHFTYSLVTCNLLCWLYIFLIILSGDVELNAGPKRKAAQTLSVCHWNLNSICAQNFTKLYLLKAYVSVHKFDFICLSETYLDSIMDDGSLEISGYYLLRSDHPSNKKCGGICIYYKNFLPLKVTGVRLLEECIVFDLIISNKLCSFVALYRSPSQSQDDFATFSDNFGFSFKEKLIFDCYSR